MHKLMYTPVKIVLKWVKILYKNDIYIIAQLFALLLLKCCSYTGLYVFNCFIFNCFVANGTNINFYCFTD